VPDTTRVGGFSGGYPARLPDLATSEARAEEHARPADVRTNSLHPASSLDIFRGIPRPLGLPPSGRSAG
jgi:hypothetical protein